MAVFLYISMQNFHNKSFWQLNNSFDPVTVVSPCKIIKPATALR